jgi:glycosyltransferase involved in cell wall biosynthesis
MRRRNLFLKAAIRSVARLGPEKGILPLITDLPSDFERRFEVALGEAGFEVQCGDQRQLFDKCNQVSRDNGNASVLPGISWEQVPPFLAGACLTIVPSLAETFGLVALESMSVGTPVIAFEVGNLPTLLKNAGVLVPIEEGASGLWYAARSLLRDYERYSSLSSGAAGAAKAYSSVDIARHWLSSL